MIRLLTDADIPACERLLSRLPDWFGLASANAAYVDSLHRLPAFVATVGDDVVGFAAVDLRQTGAAEITVMGVDPHHHRQGYGERLVEAVEAWCADHQVAWLHVKTRGPTTFDEAYERTRRFYLGVGFEPLFESLTEWGEDDAALVLVKHLACAAPAR